MLSVHLRLLSIIQYLAQEYATMRLPVIVGFGGVGPAGRSSFHHAYRLTVLKHLPATERRATLLALAVMMKLSHVENGNHVCTDGSPFDPFAYESQILNGTFIRRIEAATHFDPDHVSWQQPVNVSADADNPAHLVTRRDQLPDPLPPGWTVRELDAGRVHVEMPAGAQFSVETFRKLAVQSAGQLPTGFQPSELYNSRFHPRGLQMAIIAASDAIRASGIDWKVIANSVRPDEIAVYASSAMCQLDGPGTGGMMQARLRGKRVSSKQLPLGLNTMPADFVNAYVLGNVGATSANVGACASFLYNLRAAVEDIQSGRRRVVVVGNSEAPILPEIIEGYAAMNALATDENLRKLDDAQHPDYRRASRPFGYNCGFTLAESAQYIVVFDDALAIELGADIHGAVPDVFVNADGFKKSISAPGPGNYITLAKAVASARALLGETAVRQRSFVQAHGSSTPQNRVTESRVFDEVARAFGVSDWPVTAVKAFLGHSLAPASADQLINSLGAFRYGLLSGMKTLDKVADDVFDKRLRIAIDDLDLGGRTDVAFLNSKGFGGNNATGVVISPQVTEKMLLTRYGKTAMGDYRTRRENIRSMAHNYEHECCEGPMRPIYRFGEGIIDETEIVLDDKKLHMPGFDQDVNLDLPNPYRDMV